MAVQRLFPSNPAPGNPNAGPDGDNSYTLGCVIDIDVPFKDLAVWWRVPDTVPATIVAGLFSWTDDGAGVLLNSKTFVTAVGGWQRIAFDVPADRPAGRYVPAVYTSDRYVFTTGTFTGSPVVNGHMTGIQDVAGAHNGKLHINAGASVITYPEVSAAGNWHSVDLEIQIADAPSATGTASFTGQGALTVTGAKVATGAPSFFGAGSFTAVGGKISTGSAAYAGLGSINVRGRRGGPVTLDTYQFGPCDPWAARYPCAVTGTGAPEILTTDPTLLADATLAASQVLYFLTAQRFGTCTVKLRPCRQDCAPYAGLGVGSWWQWGTWPQPAWFNGTWYNLTCGMCQDSCGCTFISESWLPGPVNSIAEVKVDGVALVNGTDYRVDDYRKLVRLNGEMWPWCNDFAQEDTEPNTWSVTAVFGEPVPMLGQMAVGELACEFIKYFDGQTCNLPYGVDSVTRQGISMSFSDAQQLLKSGFVNLPMCDQFIRISNPSGQRARSYAFDIDGPSYRAVGTA